MSRWGGVVVRRYKRWAVLMFGVWRKKFGIAVRMTSLFDTNS